MHANRPALLAMTAGLALNTSCSPEPSTYSELRNAQEELGLALRETQLKQRDAFNFGSLRDSFGYRDPTPVYLWQNFELARETFGSATADPHPGLYPLHESMAFFVQDTNRWREIVAIKENLDESFGALSNYVVSHQRQHRLVPPEEKATSSMGHTR